MFPSTPAPERRQPAGPQYVDRSVNNCGNNYGTMAGGSVHLHQQASRPGPTRFDATGICVFVNYRRGQAHAAAIALIRRGLVDRFGPSRVFLDTSSLEAGDRYPDELRRGLQASRVVLAVIHPEWLDDLRRRQGQPGRDWVSDEIEAALQDHKVLIPVLLDGARILVEHELPGEIRDLAHRTASPLRSTDFDRDLDALVDAVATHIDS